MQAAHPSSTLGSLSGTPSIASPPPLAHSTAHSASHSPLGFLFNVCLLNQTCECLKGKGYFFFFFFSSFYLKGPSQHLEDIRYAIKLSLLLSERMNQSINQNNPNIRKCYFSTSPQYLTAIKGKEFNLPGQQQKDAMHTKSQCSSIYCFLLPDNTAGPARHIDLMSDVVLHLRGPDEIIIYSFLLHNRFPYFRKPFPFKGCQISANIRG